MRISKATVELFTFLPDTIAARLNRTPIVRRLVRGAFWTLAGSLAGRALSIPVSILLARYMGPSHYGELGIINSSIDLFMVFAGFGLGLTANKHVAEFRTKDPDRAGRILALSSVTAVLTGTVFAALLFLLAPWLASHSLAAPQLTSSIRISSLLLLLSAINGAQRGALYGFEAFRTTAQIEVLVGLVNVPLLIAGYFAGGLNGVLCGMVGTRLLDCLIRWQVLRAQARRAGINIQYSQCTQELGVLWKFSLPALLAGSMVGPVNWLCNSMLARQPNGYRELGIYNATSAWYGALLFLPVALGGALLPVLSERIGLGDRQSGAKVLSAMMRLNLVIVVPGAIALALASPLIMQLYGPAYSHAGSTLVVVVFTAAICAILMPVGDVISASGKMWTGLVMNAGWATVFLGGTWLLADLGAFGIATARLTAYTLHAVWATVYAARIIGSSLRVRTAGATKSGCTSLDSVEPSKRNNKC
ncbi:oligosaccharide flippase family protein [Paludibaculum fermentans]|uniref:oligosaccharide flippase family protein n=1 Tax=Paludibaculum fermentans TaxID=1473598 RepID=UPI003EB85713